MNSRAEEKVRRALVREGFTVAEANRALAETRGFALAERPRPPFPWRRWVWPVVIGLVTSRILLVAFTAVPFLADGNSWPRSLATAVGTIAFSEFLGFPVVTVAPGLAIIAAGLVIVSVPRGGWRLGIAALLATAAAALFVSWSVVVGTIPPAYLLALGVGMVAGVVASLVAHRRAARS